MNFNYRSQGSARDTGWTRVGATSHRLIPATATAGRGRSGNQFHMARPKPKGPSGDGFHSVGSKHGFRDSEEKERGIIAGAIANTLGQGFMSIAPKVFIAVVTMALFYHFVLNGMM